uniref:Uncharacterized protein n=1 Tax=Tanacetum cinerariifolium TaxID=118510 RepID=A0A699I8A0_TANCI|nr:hypothetical protein [Tanacetum cinerariifolium]
MEDEKFLIITQLSEYQKSDYASIIAATNPKFIRIYRQRFLKDYVLSMVCHLQHNGVTVRMGQKDAYVL